MDANHTQATTSYPEDYDTTENFSLLKELQKVNYLLTSHPNKFSSICHLGKIRGIKQQPCKDMLKVKPNLKNCYQQENGTNISMVSIPLVCWLLYTVIILEKTNHLTLN